MKSGKQRLKIGFTVLALVVMLASAGALYASGGEASGGGIPSAKLWDLLWRTMNFAGLVVILVLALKKPIANGLKGRQQEIREQFEDLEASKAEAEQTYKEYEAKLSGIDAEADKILRMAVEKGEAEKQRIIDEAHRAAEDIKRQAEMAVQHELAEATKRLREEMADQAATMAAAIIAKNLQESDQQKLVEDYLDKVGGLQ